VIAALREVVGEQLDDYTGEQVLRAARAFDHVALRQLDHDLVTRQDGLRSPVADGPWVTVRVAHALAGAGFVVVLPRCPGCGQAKVKLVRPTPQGRCCEWCVNRDRLQVCLRCGQLGHPVASRPEGMICRRCYNTDSQFVRACARCGRSRPPTARTADGGGVLCWACAPRPHRACVACGEVTTVKANTPAGPVCRDCYRHPRRLCGRCGTVAAIAIRAREGSPDLCHRCRDEILHDCGVCGNRRPAKAMWPVGPVCAGCYLHARRHPGACAECQQVRVLVARSAEGEICGPCAGSALHFACRTCGRTTELQRTDRCARCVLAEQVPQLLSGPSGVVPQQLQPLVATLINARRPDSILRWLYRYPGSFLPALAAAEQPITHATIDALPQPHRLDHLRRLLVHAGVLPAREERLERITPWLHQLLADRPAGHQRLIRPYATWAVLRAARRAAARGRYSDSRVARDRERILVALRLLDWLDSNGHTLQSLTQTDLDRWAVQHPQQGIRAAAKAFITWTNARRLTVGLAISLRRPAEPALFLPPAAHLNQLRQCIHNDDIPVDVRVAGALLLLYGTTVSRIAKLTVNDITTAGKNTFITLDRTPTLVPSKLARLIERLLASPITGSAMHLERTMLFPGQFPGQHRSAGTLVTQLNRHGIHARPARNTTLISLAADLPAAVLADLVGMNPQTAVKWSRLGQSDWTSYLSSRA
jgi:hypothetical protein